MKETRHDMDELRREAALGGRGEHVERAVPRISLADFAVRKVEIGNLLWDAAINIGFFQIVDHGIAQNEIDAAFALAERFFALPTKTKDRYPLGPGSNAGWEFKAEVRPSSGTPDNKESYQITVPRMAELWPTDEEVAGFRTTLLAFEHANWRLGMLILSCFAVKLGLKKDFFTRAHDTASPGYQSTLRLIHYMGMENALPADSKLWRAAAHSDFDCLTLLHQKSGQRGFSFAPARSWRAAVGRTLNLQRV